MVNLHFVNSKRENVFSHFFAFPLPSLIFAEINQLLFPTFVRWRHVNYFPVVLLVSCTLLYGP